MVKSYTVMPKKYIVIKGMYVFGSCGIKILIYKYLYMDKTTMAGRWRVCFSDFYLHFFRIKLA